MNLDWDDWDMGRALEPYEFAHAVDTFFQHGEPSMCHCPGSLRVTIPFSNEFS